jgi:type II secretory pathway pseudopilin PulG
MRSLRRSTAGDTIFEVLIAIGIVSLVIASAFVISNRSILNSLQAQEHSEAQKLAQSQLEQLRVMALEPGDPHNLFGLATKTYCIAVRDNLPTGTIKGDLVEFNIAAILPAPVASYPAACIDPTTVGYRTGFTFDHTKNIFTFYVNWDGATGGQDQVSMIYGAYKRD